MNLRVQISMKGREEEWIKTEPGSLTYPLFKFWAIWSFLLHAFYTLSTEQVPGVSGWSYCHQPQVSELRASQSRVLKVCHLLLSRLHPTSHTWPQQNEAISEWKRAQDTPEAPETMRRKESKKRKQIAKKRLRKSTQIIQPKRTQEGTGSFRAHCI